ncbi:proteasome activator complex subunit 3-like [Tetranychus urticae]|uniref:proteasome activator complex subunit 3-like n=1 Tax=Tetranychus urticae TaxID=32264 RepID=UPI00077B87F1|nr:proteasome activator complex subunit 3-like [Tetranychus urticae]
MESSKNILDRNIPVVPQLSEWHDQVNGKVQKLIKEDFPRKVLALNDFLAEEYFDEKYIKGIRQEMIISQSRVGLPNDLHMNHDSTKDNATTTTSKGKEIKAASIESTESQEETDHKQAITVPVNNKIKAMSNLVKPKMKEFIEDLNLIKLWIQLLIPKIEDGNNFGVEIQEEILAEVRFALSDGFTYYSFMIKYHNTRAGIVKKIEKYQFVEDYQEYLAVFDEDEWIGLKSTVIKMRNHYDRLHSLMTKNWEKLICPRASNSDTMF